MSLTNLRTSKNGRLREGTGVCVSAIVTDTRAASVSRPARGYLLQPTFPNFINEGQTFHKYVLPLSGSLSCTGNIGEREILSSDARGRNS